VVVDFPAVGVMDDGGADDAGGRVALACVAEQNFARFAVKRD
jgi:hypothetical protein